MPAEFSRVGKREGRVKKGVGHTVIHNMQKKQKGQFQGFMERAYCHRNFGPENLGPGGPKFPTNLGPAGPILPEIMVRVGNIGPLTGVYMYGPKFPAVSFTGNNGVCLGQCKYMQVIEYILHTKPE